MAGKSAGSKRLSVMQQVAVEYLSRCGEAERINFYWAGIRMPTIRSLVRRGIVTGELRRCEDDKLRVFYKLAAGE